MSQPLNRKLLEPLEPLDSVAPITEALFTEALFTEALSEQPPNERSSESLLEPESQSEPEPEPSPKRRCVLVCQYRSCGRNRAAEVLAAFQATAPRGVFASGSGCMGQCASGVTVLVTPDSTWYCRVKPEQVGLIVEQHLQADQPVQAMLHPRFHPQISHQVASLEPACSDSD